MCRYSIPKKGLLHTYLGISISIRHYFLRGKTRSFERAEILGKMYVTNGFSGQNYQTLPILEY